MGFGLNIKVEAPKVEVPKVDVAAAAFGAVSGAAGAVTGAVTGAVEGAISGISAAAAGAVAALSSVAGAIADVDVSFKGATEDFVLEPHLQLDANASFGKTKFEKGPIWIRIDMTSEEAKESTHILHVFSASGNYDEKKKICDFKENDDATIGILFEKAPMDENYSLEVILEDGENHKLINNVAYGDIRKTKQGYL
jgi:hypothetical protein